MNKLLQHIIDAGDVDHKILPGLQKMQKAGIVMFKPSVNDKPVYDNIPNPAVVRAQVQRDAIAKQALAKRNAEQAARDRQGYIRQAEPAQSIPSKTWSVLTNPMTALAYKVQGRDIPDYLERGQKNSLDIAVNMVNPFAIANAVASIPGNVARGEFLDAGLNSLNLVPALSAARQAGRVAKIATPISKGVQRFGPNNSNKGFFNYLTARGVEFDPGAIARDYKVGIQHGLAEAIPNTLGTVLRKTGIYPKARNVGRPFSEVFPRGAKKVEAIKAQDEGFDNAIDFVNEYFYPGGSNELRPVLADKIRSLYPNATGSPENFSRLSDSNPFNLTPNKLVKSTSWGSGREGLDLFDLNYINKQRGSIEGFNNPESSAFTIRNYGPYYKRPIDVATTAVHEAGHTAQKLGYVPNFKNPAITNEPITWGDELASFDDVTGNYKANLNTGLGKLYGKSMIEDGSWSASPLELHSELLSEKYTDYLRSLADKSKVSSSLRNVPLDRDIISQVANPSDDVLRRILNRGNLDKHFKPETTLEDRLKLLRMLPAVAPVAAAGALGANQQRYGGENNMFRVFAQEGVEYKGPSIVDYLATKGYSGKKEFRKELADKYGIEDYDFSAAKNTQLLNKLRESDELLRQYDQTMTPVPVERMMEMEQQARAARQAAAQSNTQPVRRPAPVYNFSPEFQNMRIPEIKVNTSLQPKAVYDKFSLKPKMVIPMPFGFNKTTPAPEVSNTEITDPVVPARPRLNIPQFNPFAKPQVKPELGPFISDRYNDVQEVDPPTQQGTPEFLFNSEKLFNSFYRPKQKPLLPVVAANKPVVKTEKYTKPEVEELPWYEEAANAVTNTLKGFYDSFAESVNNSSLDFRQMNFGTPMSPQGAQAMTRDLTRRGLSLFSPDMAEKYDNWLNRQQAIKNMDKDPVSKIVVPDFDYAPMYITGDTIPDSERQYHLPESMDLNALKFGVRNRGDLTPIDTEAASITAFHPFVDAKLYFTQIADDPANATYLGITPDGQVKVGGRKDVENKDIKITRVFSNKVVDFLRDPTGGIKKVPAGAKVNKNAFSPAVTVIGDDGKQKEGKLNLVVPQGTKADDAFGVATGGRFIFQTPDGQSRLVSGSLKNIEEEFKRIKGKNPYVTVISLDNGSFSRGLRTRDKRLTATDLRSYDNLNTGGGNFAYLLPGQQTSRPLAKFAEFEQEATKKLQSLYPGKKVSVGYQNTGLYDQSGGRDIQSQLDIQKKGNSQTPVSLHNFGAAKDYVLYVDGKAIDANKDKKIYKDVLWNTADKVGMYHLEEWDPAHISLAKEGQKTAFDELKSKYPEIFTDPNFVKSLEFINKNKNNPAYQEYYELLNNIQPFTGAPRTTEFMKKNSSTKKAFGGPILDARGQWAHPGKVTRIPGSDITMQGVPYPVFGVGSNGQEQMMYPGQEYNFGGASYVDEYPMMQGGGSWSGAGLSRSNLAMMSALNKDIKNQKARNSQYSFSQYTPKPGDQQRMNANKDAYRKEQGKFLNRLADNQHMQAAAKNLPGAAEFALDVMTAGEAGLALKAAKPLLKAAGKYLTEKTPLRNAYKLNRSALTDDMLFNKEGVVNRQIFGDDAYNKFLEYGPTTRPNVSEYDQMMEFIKAPRSEVRSGSGEVFQIAKTMEDGAFKYPYFQEGNLWYTGQQRNNLANQLGKERIITTPKSDVWFAPAGEGSVMEGDNLSKGLIDSYSKGRRVLMPGSEYAKPSKYSVFEPHWWKGYKQIQKKGGQIYPMMQSGGFKPPFSGTFEDAKKRWEDGYIPPKPTNAAVPERKFLTDWNNSPMGKQMLYNSVDKDDPSGINSLYADKIIRDRDALVKQSKVNVYNHKTYNKLISKYPDFTASSDPDSGTAGYASRGRLNFNNNKFDKYTFNAGLGMPNNKYAYFSTFEPKNDYDIHLHNESEADASNQTLVHELSHASDASGYLMPLADEKKIKTYSYGSDGKRKLTDYQKYVADPSETRARLLNFRYNAKNQGIYNPFTQKATFDSLKKYEDRIGSGYDPLQQLRDVYTDSQIIDMLNTISKKQSNELLPFAKNGGQHGGLDRWFAEKWVDVKTGKACGRQEGEKRAGYPACRPSKRVSSETPKTASEMSSAEKAKFKASKTSSQRINYNHKRNK